MSTKGGKKQIKTDSEWTADAFIPRNYSKTNRIKLINFLKEKNLGNDSTRNLFISDVELWLGMLDEKKGRSPDEIKVQLKDIAKKSEELINLLGRSYQETDEWIIEGITAASLKTNRATIENSIKTLRDSCSWSINAATPNRIARSITGEQREFIKQIAESYRRHFSEEPLPSRKTKFKQVLEKIERLSEVKSASEKTLKQVLG